MTDPAAAGRVDAHHHVWDLAVRDQPWTVGLSRLRRSFSMADLRPELVAHRMSATVLVQTVTVADETPELLELAMSDDHIAGVVGWVDLTAPGVADDLARLQAGPGGTSLVAVRHQVQDEPDPAWLYRPEVRRGLRAVGAVGLAYDLVVTRGQLDAVVDTVAALPELTFVLDHAGKPAIAAGTLEPWRTQLTALAALPNCAVKLSGLVTEADPATWRLADLRPFAETVLTAFTPARVMFGSDWPVCLLAASYGEVVAAAEQLCAELSPDDQAAVFGATATAIYGLGPR